MKVLFYMFNPVFFLDLSYASAGLHHITQNLAVYNELSFHNILNKEHSSVPFISCVFGKM